jgi:hypothetical protein
VPSKDKQEVLAQDERQGAIDMRARFRVVSEQIANELVALSRSAAQMPSAERAAVLSAANQIAKTQEGMCDEAARAPMALELHLGVMQDLLDGLLHLGAIVRQQAPRGLDPVLMVRMKVARSQIALLTRVKEDLQGRASEALLAHLTQDLQGRVSDLDFRTRLTDAQIPGYGSVAAGSRRQTKSGVVRARQSALTLVNKIASLSLGVVAAGGAGLLMNYANHPSASNQSESAAKQLDLPRPTMVGATPLPVPRSDTSASTESSPSVITPAPSAADAVASAAGECRR